LRAGGEALTRQGAEPTSEMVERAASRASRAIAISALRASTQAPAKVGPRYLLRQRSKTDGRSFSLRLTNKGKKALTRDPFEVLVRAVDSLDAKEQTAMRHALHQVLTTVAASGAHQRFGICQDCAHFGREFCGNLPSTNPLAAKCLLLDVPIQSEDAGLLCVHFQPSSECRDGGHH
jgi:hypothetical protein